MNFSDLRQRLQRILRGLRARASRHQRRPRLLRFEQLEPRLTLAADLESIDGTGNNLLHPDWGSAGTAFLRLAPAQYADGISTPAGGDRPSARAISNALAAHPATDLINNRDLSAFIYAWGQFLDHDIDLTLSGSERFNIAVPLGDPWFDPNATGTQVIGLVRSGFDPATGVTSARQQVNAITAFIDGSQVYGSDAETAASLRTFVGGKLKTSDGNLLPTDPNNPAFFTAGDVRANENVELIAMQTLFVREHNRLADQLAKGNPQLSDEQIYQQARRMVIGELQVITYKEFLPALLGPGALRPYAGYNPKVNPGIANEFATAAFRLGHSMLGSDVEFLDNNGQSVRDSVGLREAFFNPDLVRETGIDPILKYLASDRAEEIDTRVVDDVRNFLFGAPGQGGLDLASLNIQRGRDHGLADYNTVRAAYGLPRVKSFAEITSDPNLQKQLKDVYGSVDKVDLWVGGLAETHLPGASVGPLFARIIGDQFARLRDGDRFWYQRVFSGDELRRLEQTTLAEVIRNNTTISNLQPNVFFFRTSISGQVFADNNQDGRHQAVEQGIAGVVVQLLDGSGNVVATARTGPDGSYCFSGLELGAYRVQPAAPQGAKVTTAAIDVVLTRGIDVRQIDVGLFRGGPQKDSKPALPLAQLAPPRPGALLPLLDALPTDNRPSAPRR